MQLVLDGVERRFACPQLGRAAFKLRFTGLQLGFDGLIIGLLLVQRTQAGLDLEQLLVNRLLPVAEVLAGQVRLGGLNYLQVDGPDAQAIAGFEQRFAEVSPVQTGVGRPTANHRPAGAAQNQAMDRPYLVSPQSQCTMVARPDRAFGRLEPDDLAVAGRSPHAEDEKTGCGGQNRG